MYSLLQCFNCSHTYTRSTFKATLPFPTAVLNNHKRSLGHANLVIDHVVFICSHSI